ncbi:hypothetical protein BjapCC829_36475 [Bradyrhizobium barranii]|uniref:Uncharacterized protein n=1 Tax=Bradyrhizobium barranii TaxID=2992140 RepID=A0ABY3QIE2_9BRAD|nr:hypothetical protein [Bradyrhizobium japonicum]UFW85361.1 hypothetical protein BjapCC829_36475 [Bradyrhizobium japonicum]
MRIIRSRPATGKPPKIICTGCGERAREAGVAVPDWAVEKTHGPEFQGPDGPVGVSVIIDEDETQPLCEACLIAFERGQAHTTGTQ